jgi:hypothetical protein
MTARVVLLLSLVGGCDLLGQQEVHAVGSRSYHASAEACSLERDDTGVLTVFPHDPSVADGKGIVFEAMHPGHAIVRCGSTRTTIVVREAERIELERLSEADPVVGDLYAPTVCVRAFDHTGAPLSLGSHTEGIVFETSNHLRSVSWSGMPFEPNPTCAGLHHPAKAGQAEVRASWRGLTARHPMRIAAP